MADIQVCEVFYTPNQRYVRIVDPVPGVDLQPTKMGVLNRDRDAFQFSALSAPLRIGERTGVQLYHFNPKRNGCINLSLIRFDK